MKVIISGYLKYGETIGLYNVSQNMKHRKLDQTNINSPSFIIYGDGFYYTFEKGSKTSLYSYKVVEEGLVQVDKFTVPGTGLTHLAYSEKHKVLYACSYGDGTFLAVRVEDGMFKELLNYQRQITDGRLSRPHAVLIDEEEKEVAIINIALDAIYFYEFRDDRLRYKDVLALPIGKGPRHGVYYNGLIYVVTEYSNEVLVIDRHEKKIIQTISTIPNYDKTSYGATLVFSLDKKYLYVSNRGEDTIAKFKVLENKLLEYCNSFSCGGNHPRHMVLSKDGKYIISCNKDSNNVSFINLHEERVVLSFPFGEPAGVVEINEEV